MGCRFSTRVRRPVLRLIRCIARAPVTGRCSRFLRRLRVLSARAAGGGGVGVFLGGFAVFGGPVVGGVETFYVVVGTGWHLEVPDGASTIGQSVYVIYDNGSARADASPAGSAIAGRGRLQQGVVDRGNETVSVRAFRWGRPRSDADVATRAGWFFDLPVSGERIDQAALDLGDLSALVQ